MWPAILAGLRGLMGRAALSSAVRAAGAEAGAEAGPAKGMIRFYHGGTAYSGGSRWLSEEKSYAEGYAKKSGGKLHFVDVPESHPFLKTVNKAYDDTGLNQRAPYVHFEAPESIAKGLKPYQESSFVNVQGKEPRSGAPSFYGNMMNAARMAAQSSYESTRQRFSQSSVADFYRAARDVSSWTPPAIAPGPPKFQPNVDPTGNFPNLTEDQMVNLSKGGASLQDFVDADKRAELNQKEKEAQQELLDSTKKLGDSFLKLVTGPVKGVFGLTLGSMAYTKASGAYLDTQATYYSQYSADYLKIEGERRIQQIQLDQRMATSTSSSAAFLNRQQMAGQDQLFEIARDLKIITNTAIGLGQATVNATLMISRFSRLFIAIQSIARIAEWWHEKAGGKNDEPLNALTLIQLARESQQRGNQKQLPPLRPVK